METTMAPHYQITGKGALMMAVPMDNRGVTSANFERTYRKLAQDVVGTADLWNSGVDSGHGTPVRRSRS